MPCCATDKGGDGTADPLNLIVIGDVRDVYYAFIRAGWDETEATEAMIVVAVEAMSRCAGTARAIDALRYELENLGGTIDTVFVRSR